MPLYVYSERPDMATLAPTPPEARPDGDPVLLAVDEWHAATQCAPRDCPRVCYWATPRTTPGDSARYLMGGATRMVIAVEWSWYERLRAATLYRYLVPEEPFRPVNDAGVYSAREVVTVLDAERIEDPLAELRRSGVELRVCPTIAPLGEAIMQTTLKFTLLRMRNAVGWRG